MRVAAMHLKSSYIDREMIFLIVKACQDARLEAIKAGKLHEEVPVEFLSMGVVLFSSKQNYRVYAPELERNLRGMNLLERYEETYA